MTAESIKISSPLVEPKYKGIFKLPRVGLRNVEVRATKGYIFIEFESTNIPKISLEITDD
jgi:hypothetical protein